MGKIFVDVGGTEESRNLGRFPKPKKLFTAILVKGKILPKEKTKQNLCNNDVLMKCVP